MLTLFEQALVVHFLADWILQNDWMAIHKQRLTQPAAWVHGAIHALLLSWVLGWQAGATLGALHILIDSRYPLRWWANCFGKTLTGEQGLHVAIWSDQVLHVTAIAAWLTWCV